MRFKIQVADCKHGGCAHLCNHLISVIHPSIHPIFRTALSSLDSLSFKNISFFFFFFSLSYILQSRSFYFYFLIWQKTGIHRALIKICTQLDVSSPALQTLSCCWAVVGKQWLHFAPRSRQRLHPHPPHPPQASRRASPAPYAAFVHHKCSLFFKPPNSSKKHLRRKRAILKSICASF